MHLPRKWKLREAAVPRPGKSFKDRPECPEMVVIPAGSFGMGGNTSSDETPTHGVTLKIFTLAKTELTQGQWKAVMGSYPSYFDSCGDDCPVESVSWNDAQEYVKKLSAKTGKHYRLPSEAEREYACRAGRRQKYCGSVNIDSFAWYDGKRGSKTTHRAAERLANVGDL